MFANSVYHIEPSGPSQAQRKTHKLVLTTTSLRNVVLANASDVLYYEVVTPAWERHRTRVSRLDVNTRAFSVVAELLNGHAPGDVHGREEDAKRAMALRMHGAGEFRAVDEFLHVETRMEGQGAPADPKGKGKGRAQEEKVEAILAWYRAKDGRKYTWRGDEERLELVRDDRPDKPVAAYHKEKRYLHVLRMSQHPYLEVDPDPAIIEGLDYLIVSFLLVERLRREHWCS